MGLVWAGLLAVALGTGTGRVVALALTLGTGTGRSVAPYDCYWGCGGCR